MQTVAPGAVTTFDNVSGYTISFTGAKGFPVPSDRSDQTVSGAAVVRFPPATLADASVVRRLRFAVRMSEDDQIGSPLDTELGEQVGNVELHGSLRHVQPLCDLPIGQILEQ